MPLKNTSKLIADYGYILSNYEISDESDDVLKQLIRFDPTKPDLFQRQGRAMPQDIPDDEKYTPFHAQYDFVLTLANTLEQAQLKALITRMIELEIERSGEGRPFLRGNEVTKVFLAYQSVQFPDDSNESIDYIQKHVYSESSEKKQREFNNFKNVIIAPAKKQYLITKTLLLLSDKTVFGVEEQNKWRARLAELDNKILKEPSFKSDVHQEKFIDFYMAELTLISDIVETKHALKNSDNDSYTILLNEALSDHQATYDKLDEMQFIEDSFQSLFEDLKFPADRVADIKREITDLKDTLSGNNLLVGLRTKLRLCEYIHKIAQLNFELNQAELEYADSPRDIKVIRKDLDKVFPPFNELENKFEKEFEKGLSNTQSWKHKLSAARISSEDTIQQFKLFKQIIGLSVWGKSPPRGIRKIREAIKDVEGKEISAESLSSFFETVKKISTDKRWFSLFFRSYEMADLYEAIASSENLTDLNTAISNSKSLSEIHDKESTSIVFRK